MKSNYIVRAQKFMETFYPYMRKYRIGDAVNHFNEDKHRAVQCRQGAVRRVLITSDYVIKWDYDKRNSKTFGGCREEYKTYQKVKDDYYGYLFAEITPIKVRNRTFYVMPRVNMRASQEGGRAEYYLDGAEREFVDDYLYDLHDENFGWKNNRLVIFDYAYNVFMEQKNCKG